MHLLDSTENLVEQTLIDHRYSEVLLALLLQGEGTILFHRPQYRWSDKVSQIVATDPAYNWSMNCLINKLNVSEATLRRRLKEEKTSYRAILDEQRLNFGLYLLQSGLEKRAIGHVSSQCGYQSASAFSARFKERFGMLPSELQKTVI